MVKLVNVVKSPNVTKKYRAIFDNGKHTDFGQAGAMDYILYNKQEGKQIADIRKNLYMARHKRDLETKDNTRSGYLSMYILWNKPTLEASIDDYKKRFNV